MNTSFVTSTTYKVFDKSKGAFRAMHRNAREATRSFRQLKVAGRGVEKMGRSMSMSISAPMIAAGANSVRMAADFDGAMNQVRAKLMIGKEAAKELRDQAKLLGSETAFSATQAANAQAFLAQAGFDAGNILTATPATLNLAAAANLELAEAADIASNIFGAFGMVMDKEGKQIGRMTDVLSLATARSNLNVQEMAESMKDAGPMAHGFGMSLEETAATIGMLANMGIKGTNAGTAMKNMLVNLTDPASKAQESLAKLNLTKSSFFKKENGKEIFQGTAKMLEQLKEAGASSTDLISIFGKIAGPKVMALMSSGAGAVKGLTNELVNSEGAAEKMANTMMDGLPGVIAGFKSAFEAINIAAVESGAFKPIIDGIKLVTNKFREWSKANPELIKTIVQIGGVIAIVGPALIGLGIAFKVTAMAMAALKFGAVFKGMALMFKVLSGGLLFSIKSLSFLVGKGLVIAFKSLALLFTPGGAILAGIVAFAYGAYKIYKHWGAIYEWASDTFGGLVDVIKSAFSGLGTFFDLVFLGIKNTFSKGVLKIAQGIQSAAGALSFAIPDNILKEIDNFVVGQQLTVDQGEAKQMEMIQRISMGEGVKPIESQQNGKIDTNITVKIDQNGRVINTGVESNKSGGAVGDLGVSFDQYGLL